MANSERNYGYNVTTSYHPGIEYPTGNVILPPTVEMDVYRVSTKTTEGGRSYLDKINIARFNSTTDVQSNVYSGTHGVSAVEAHLLAKDFQAAHPEATPDERLYHGAILANDVRLEIATAEEEAHEIENRRLEVALAVQGLDLATADRIAELQASEASAEMLGQEQVLPVQE